MTRKNPETSLSAWKQVTPDMLIDQRRQCKRRNVYIGQKFGKLVIISEIHRNWHTSKNGLSRFRYYVDCKCDCGKNKRVETNKLLSGYTKSCGCIVDKNGIPYLTKTHGMSGTNEYKIYIGIKRRCYEITDPMYYRYGAVGIKMSEEWFNSFDIFYRDMGERPSKIHSVDRFPEKSGNYCKENCRWATAKEQANNTKININITINGITKTMTEWSELNGIKPKTASARIISGWDKIDAVTHPKKINQYDKK